MENATKALLIAGSVLIAILIIAFGLRIFNSTKGTTEATQTAMNATEVATFNNKFIQYMGNHRSKSQVIALANVIIANNSSSNYKVEFSAFGPSSGPFTEAEDILSYINGFFASYNASAVYCITYETAEDGRINRINIY